MNSLTLSQKLIYILSQKMLITEDHIINISNILDNDTLLDYVKLNFDDEVYNQIYTLMNS